MWIGRLLGLFIIGVLFWDVKNQGQSILTQGCTVIVQPSQSIQKVIASAPIGAVICLGAGTWREMLNISKDLTLRGMGRELTIIEGISSGWGIDIWGSAQVMISGIAVRNFMRGIYISEMAKVVIENCQISNNREYGIRLDGAAQVIIQNSKILGNERGIRILGEAQVTLRNSQVSHSGDQYGSCDGCHGIYISERAQASLQNLQIFENKGLGILAEHSNATQVIIENSRIFSNRFGIAWFGGRLTIQNSQVYNNQFDGIQLIGETFKARVFNNIIRDNKGYGIYTNRVYNIVECGGNASTNNDKGDFHPLELAQRCS